MDLEAADYLALGIFLIAAALCLLLWGTARRRAAAWVWTAALVLTGVPFADLHAHAHWYKVAWIPFVSPPQKASDIIANILIYMPLGFLSAPGPASRRYRTMILAAGALSFVIEATQVFSHGRIPSTTDVVSDVIGAAAGVAVSEWFGRTRSTASRHPTA